MKRYDPKTLEPKWQKVWADTKLYEVEEDDSKTKIYATPMLPYPSGAGLHVGHVRNYSIADAVARFYRQKGYNVMSNIAWDAFGLPAENYAIKTGTPPWESTAANIENFRTQLQRLGMSYAWEREFNTSDPSYYKWTQWIFNQLFRDGLAYQGVSMQWWCPECKTVLANEQVENGCCWRHPETKVEKRETKQWFFKITEYADPLLDNLDNLDWPERITSQQKNWIGRSQGAEISFKIEGSEETLSVFTTRHDTQFGVTFMVLSPEHPLVEKITTDKYHDSVQSYVSEAALKSNLERLQDEKEKSGVNTGAFAINPVNDERIPIWVADYVLMDYGTGAVMGVPGHDMRDKEFIEKHGLEMRKVYETPDGEDDYHTEGIVINSGKYDGLTTQEAREKILADLVKSGDAVEKTHYRIRDWLISRQRYWGAPIPIIHCDKCGTVAVPDADLPVELPKVENFAPTGDTVSVLAAVEDWVSVKCPKCGGQAQRETDTMDGYACSSWYMHRYADAKNDDKPFDPNKLNYWFPVDFYFGGDHAVSHLLYFRFWNHFFVDKGWVDKEYVEPVKRLVFNGYINAADGRKMSKSFNNVVDPLEVIDSGYGADALRMFELFIGPYDQDVDWNTNGVPGTFRFLQRVWTLVQEFLEENPKSHKTKSRDGDLQAALRSSTHKTIRKVTADLEALKFNTAIAACMELTNSMIKLREELPFAAAPDAWRESLSQLVQILAPFAPHIAEELWEELGFSKSVHVSGWPVWDDDLIREEIITIVVQVNGKVRANLDATKDENMADIVDRAKATESVSRHLADKEIIKTIEVPHRLVNFVVK